MDVAAFHRQRRMFGIIGGKLYLAEPGAADSHIAWFCRAGWMAGPSDPLFETVVRGYVDSARVHFYSGADFRVDPAMERVFFAHFEDLVMRLDLLLERPVCGGVIPQETPGRWPVRRTYGTVGSVRESLQRGETPSGQV